MKLPAFVASLLLASDTACAWTFNVSNVVSPKNIGDKHEHLKRTWTISSFAQLQQLYLAVPGPVFVDLHPSLVPPVEGSGTDAPSTQSSETPGVIPGVTPGVVPGVTPGVVPGQTPGVGSNVVPSGEPGQVSDAAPTSEMNPGLKAPSLSNATVELSKHRRRHNDIEESQSRGEETVVAMIVISGNSSELLNMFEAAPLEPHRNDGLKLHLKNEDALAEGYVLTQIYLFDKNLLRRVTTALHGDVVLNAHVMTLNDTEADVKFACVGEGNLYFESNSNVTWNSLEVEVTGKGLVQLSISSLSIETSLDVKIAGSGAFALISNSLFADEIKSTLSGSGILVFNTNNLVAQRLVSSVYGSGVTSFATAGTVDKESLALSGSGQLLAGSIVANKSNVDVWGDGELLVQVIDKLTVSTSVWGKVGYVNAPPAHIKIKGWWFWRDASSIVHPAAVNKVVIYEPVTVPVKEPVYCFVETVKSALSDEPGCALVSPGNNYTVDLMTTSLSKGVQSDETSNPFGLLYAFIGAGVVVMNVVAARSWAQRRARRHYTPLL